jgi:hypothetical protein
MDKPRTHSHYRLWGWMMSAAQLEGEMVDLELEAGLVGASMSNEETLFMQI